jgi:hypothetical protein
MIIHALILQLQALAAGGQHRIDAACTFAGEMEPVKGAIITRHLETHFVVLNLAPTKPGRVGGS